MHAAHSRAQLSMSNYRKLWSLVDVATHKEPLQKYAFNIVCTARECRLNPSRPHVRSHRMHLASQLRSGTTFYNVYKIADTCTCAKVITFHYPCGDPACSFVQPQPYGRPWMREPIALNCSILRIHTFIISNIIGYIWLAYCFNKCATENANTREFDQPVNWVNQLTHLTLASTKTAPYSMSIAIRLYVSRERLYESIIYEWSEWASESRKVVNSSSSLVGVLIAKYTASLESRSTIDYTPRVWCVRDILVENTSLSLG